MTPIQKVLALWKAGAISTQSVVAWADEEILRTERPSQDLIDLSMHGPDKCLKRASDDFKSAPTPLTFQEEFAFRALSTNRNSDDSLAIFAKWVAQHAMGQDLEDPMVSLGYYVDHYLDDCQDLQSAIRIIREELPKLLPNCHALVAPFLEQVPNLALNPDAPSASPHPL